MRDLTTRQKVLDFMRHFGRNARIPTRVYFTGGATAVLHGWRESTVDIDMRFSPEPDELYRSLSVIKEQLDINIELASPSDFIPPLPGWEDRSQFICREGKVDFFHCDLYSQALSKIERGHSQDIKDVESMLRDGSIKKDKLAALFREIAPLLFRYPAIDPESFAAAVEQITEN